MAMRLRLPALLAAALLPLLTTARAADPPAGADAAAQTDVQALQDRATAAFDRADFAAARDALVEVLEAKPNNPAVLYNLACALAQTGQTNDATRRLLDAITYGWVDFFQVERDPHLRPLYETTEYKTILLGWRDLLDARGDSNLEAARQAFGQRYTYTKDPALRLVFAEAFDARTFEEAQRDIDRVARWAFKNLFTDLRIDDGTDPRPDPWVTVVLPTPEDFVRMIRSANVGGFYDHDRRRLISQDVGPSFRHEFLHVLHWRDLSRRDQKPPDWIMEGLGTLVEDVRVEEDGGITPVPSWRTNIAKRVERMGRLVPWRRLMTMPRAQFVGVRPNAQYAQARAIMLYLYDTGKLTAWYAAFVEGYAHDPTGVAALEAVYGKPLEEIERDHRVWIRSLPDVAEEVRPGMASLGVVISPGRGDGPAVQEVTPGDAGDKAGMRVRDVIVAIDGRSTRTMEDLVRILSDYEPGDTVVVDVRRGTLRIELRAELRPAR